MSDIKLRPYQQKFIDDIREQMKLGHKHICGVAPCGAGKTIITGWLARELSQSGKRILFMVHRKELIEQTSKTFSDLGIEHGIIASGVKVDYKPLVQIASVQTLVKRLNRVPEPELLIVDECHHILANSYMKIIRYWDPWILGVTATPERLGGITLNDVFESMIVGPSVGSLIKLKSLTNFKYLVPKNSIDTSGLRSKFGEYRTDDMMNLMDQSRVIDDVVKSYKKYANGKQAIVYCVNIAHSEHISRMFNIAGVSAAHVDGETDKSTRSNIIEEFRKGNITVLCNAELFGEGFDVPNMECVILARPTMSLTLYIQQAMRPLRPDPKNPNKVAIIIDHVENVKRFGLPDEDRKWSLDPNEIKDRQPAPTKTCPECYAEVYAKVDVCPHCGYEFKPEIEIEEEEEKTESIIELNEYADTQLKNYENERVDNVIISVPTIRERVEKLLEEANERGYKKAWAFYKVVEYAETLEDFEVIAECLNYKKGWAWYQWQNKLNGKFDQEKERPKNKSYQEERSTKNFSESDILTRIKRYHHFFPRATL